MVKLYSHEQAYKEALAFYDDDKMPADVFLGKYAAKIGKDYLEATPPQLHLRETKEFARIEKKYDNPMSEKEIFCLLSDVSHLSQNVINSSTLEELSYHSKGFGAIVPQGSPMAGIGVKNKYQSLSNCFVIPQPYDSYSGILKTDQEQAQIMKRRGGVGFDLSSIRPKGMYTNNSANTTDGVGIFMERFSNTCREVAQGGRRGALMLTLDVRHPEIETFINIKRDKLKVTGANISVKFTNEFMQAVENDDEFTLYWPIEMGVENASVKKVVRARDVWDQFIDAAWYSAEPGALFWDNAIKYTPSDIYSKFGYNSISTNPCGEIVLSAYDSCRLLVVNTLKFVRNSFQKNSFFDFQAFNETVIKAQRLMDDLIDLEIEAVDNIIQKIKKDPEPDEIKQTELNLWMKIKQAAINGRRTGLGITGLGDTLAALNVKYGTDTSINWTNDIYKSLAINAYKSSVQLACERGAFPIYDAELEQGHEFLERIFDQDQELKANHAKYGRRNIALTTTAPVGSVSILTQTTSGIEPAYLLSYKRRRKINQNDVEAKIDFIDDLGDKWHEYTVYHKGVKEWMDVTSNSNIEESPYWGATSADVDWKSGVYLQAAAQKWICHSISRTSNLPKSATHELINEIYIAAWKSGCKGFTVYRDQSRTGVLLTGADASNWFEGISDQELLKAVEIGEKYAQNMPLHYNKFVKEMHDELYKRSGISNGNRPETILDIHAPKRPSELPCDIHRVNVKGESYVVLVGLFNNKPYEVFCGLSGNFEFPKKFKSGFISNGGKKNGVASYNLRIPISDDDSLTFKDIVTLFDNPVYGVFTRTISLALRHGIPIQFLVEQLRKDKNSDITSFSSVIARVLSKNYIKDGTKASNGKTCDRCNSTNLIYHEGCLSCLDCGNSNCS